MLAASGKDMTMTDANNAGESRRGPLLRERLPAVLDLVINRVPFEPSKLKFIESVRRDVKEVIAIELKLDGSLPVDMNATPVLYVGRTEISHAERGEKSGYVRFLVFPDEWEKLEEGAPIALGWPGRGPDRRESSRFRYKAPPAR